MAECMVAILKKIDLGHPGSIFSSEKVTPEYTFAPKYNYSRREVSARESL